MTALQISRQAKEQRFTCVSHGTRSQLKFVGTPGGVGDDPFTHGSTSVMFVIEAFPERFVMTSSCRPDLSTVQRWCVPDAPAIIESRSSSTLCDARAIIRPVDPRPDSVHRHTPPAVMFS